MAIIYMKQTNYYAICTFILPKTYPGFHYGPPLL